MEPLDEAKQGLMRAHTADRAKSGAQDPMDYVALGYLTPDGQATPFGDEFVAMVQGGLLEKDGTPTKEGEAYRMTHSESLEAPLEIYRLREERGLNQAEKDAAPDDGGFMGMLGKFATVGVPRLAETYWNSYAAPAIEYATVIPRKIIEKVTGDTIDLPRTKQTFDEKVNAISENITGGILASEGLASGAKYHAELAAADPGAYMQAAGDFLPGVSDLIRAVHGDETVTENIRMKADEAFAAKQRWELHNAEVAELKGAEMMDWLTDSDQWLQSRAALVAKDGEAAVKKNEEVDRLTGNFLLDPNNIASVGVGKMISGAVGSASRIALGAEKLALRSKVLQMGHAAAVAERTTLEAGATRAAAISKGAGDRAAAMRAVGNEAQAVRYENLATKLEEKAGGLVSRVDELAATEAKLAGEIEKIGAKAGVADAIVRTTERARAIRQMPATAFGEVSERIGTALVKTDEFLADAAERVGITGVYKSMHSLPMRVGTFASSAVLGPVASAAAIGSQIMASGPFLQSIGNFSKVLGKELVMERGSVPFWRRVANNSTITKTQRFLAHRMDEATLGGMATDVARPVITGTAHAYPMNLAFEVLQNPEQDFGSAAEHAFGPSLVFGGGTAGAGAIFKGSKQRLKEVRIADELNFTRNLDDGNKAGYNGISRGARRVVSTYAAAFPNLNWDFGHAGSSHYDPTTNTARINPAGGNPLRALIGHEVLHYVTIRNQMEPVIHSMLLGDAETPGLLRKTDGTLDPDFQRFRDEYDSRMDAAGLERVSLQKIAEEYFNEATVDHLLEMVDSGELSRMAGRTHAGRHIRAFIAATIPRSVILKDFFFRSGGVMEAGGRRVMGNGLLADGIRELPEAKAMMRNMVKKSAGEAVFQQPSEKGDRTGVPLPIQQGDPIIDSFHAILQTDANGVPLKDAHGNHIALSRATDEARSSVGHVITEAQTRRVQAGHMPAEGEMKANDNGTWSGEFIDRPLIDALAAKGILNAKQIAIIRNISTATKGGQGFRFLLTNHPATVKGRGGKVKYATLAATLRETVPVGFGITKDGNILVHLMSVHQLDANIQSRAASKRGRSLYNGNTEIIKQDVAAMMDLHRANTKTDKFYQDKYGAKWQEHQQFINTVFGLMTKAQAEINPMFRQDNINSPKEHVYRTYRLDRISKATKMDGTPMPFGYERVKVNFLPDGVKEMTPGTPAHDAAYLEAAESGDMATAQRMVDEAAKAAGYNLSHREEKGIDWSTKQNVVQFVDWAPNNQGRNAHYGESNYLIRSSDLKPVPNFVVEWVAENDPDIRDYSESSGVDAVEIARSALNPPDIVSGADFWDNREAVSRLWYEFEEKLSIGFLTPDGAVIFDPYTAAERGVAKSADPVTRDERGKIIPLSERFNAQSADLRYLPEPLDGGGKSGGMTPIPEHLGFQKGFMRIGDLPRDIKEAMFNEYATFVNPEAKESQFYKKTVPFGMIKTKDLIVENIPDSQIQSFKGIDTMPPIAIADGKLIDGQHRILSARKAGQTAIKYIDVSGLTDTSEHGAGFISHLPPKP